jgi:starch synthase
MRIAHVAAEFAGLAQTGGLGEVVAALAKQLARRNHDVRVFLPLYSLIELEGLALSPIEAIQEVVVGFDSTEFTFSACSLALGESSAVVYLIDCPAAFGYPTLYTSGEDEPLRFALLGRAALECCQRLDWPPEIVHCHDWHAALVPSYLKTLYEWDSLLEQSRTVLTIHNLAFQGVFSRQVGQDLGLAEELAAADRTSVEEGDLSFLAMGIRHADRLTTVSPTYAREIQTAEHGFGLAEALRERREDLVGILNGVDYEEWNPEVDRLIPSRYSAEDLSGKIENKKALLERMGLAEKGTAPVLGAVSRLTEQKGFALFPPVMTELLSAHDLRLVILGTGDAEFEGYFARLAAEYPSKVAYQRDFDVRLAHLIQAGSDIFLMPSRFEPCGLGQMYGLRYGTVPVVHRTGGLADTVEPFDPERGAGTGFVFEEFTPEGFRGSLDRALEVFFERDRWRRLMLNGMAVDFSWERQVGEYLEVYRDLAGAGVRGSGLELSGHDHTTT